MDDYHTVINMQTTTPSDPKRGSGTNMPVSFGVDIDRFLSSADGDSKTQLPSGNVVGLVQHAEEKNLDLLEKVYSLVKSSEDSSQMERDWQQILYLIGQQSPTSNTILHIAASFGNDKVVEFLTSKAPFLVANKNLNDDYPLHVAARAGDFAILEKLIQGYFRKLQKARAEIFENTKKFLEAKNKQGNTILHEAFIRKEHQDIIIQLFDGITIPDGKGKQLSVHVFEVAPQVINNNNKSALYLATEMGCYNIVNWILENYCSGEDNKSKIPQGKSPLLAAIMNPKHQEMLGIMLEKNKDWIHLKDEEGRIALHWAASVGNLDAVRCLLKKCGTCSIQSDNNGSYALHLASEGGHLEVLKELLIHCLDPLEIVDNKGRNILHIAAARGKLNVVQYILQDPKLGKMINEIDADGNTPLHLATLHNRPKVVYALTWDKRVNLNKINFRNQTALDVNKERPDRESQSLRQRLVWTALKAAGATKSPINILPQRSPEKKKSEDKSSEGTQKEDHKISEEEVKQDENLESKKGPDTEKFKDRIETLIVVSTLIITATFTGGFTLPGGNDNNNHGYPSMVYRAMFHLYIYCITISMYGAISVTIILIWARLEDVILLSLAVKFARPLLGVTIGTLSLAFLCGVYLVTSPVSWLASSFLVIAVICLIMVLSLYTLLWFPSTSTVPIFRYISHYPFLALAHVAELDDTDKGSRHTALGIV